MAFKTADGLSSKLTQALTAAGTSISTDPSFTSKLMTILPADGDYTYVTITTVNGGYEIIKIENNATGFAVIRAQGGTTAINAPIGSCIKFETNSLVVSTLIANGGVAPNVCEIVAGAGLELVKDGCKHTLSVKWPTCPERTFLGAKFKIENGCLIIEEPDNCGCVITNGTYENATVTIKDGRICAIQTGANPQYVSPSCTCCNCAPVTP